jgi:hypothetical protein
LSVRTSSSVRFFISSTYFGSWVKDSWNQCNAARHCTGRYCFYM